MSESQTKEPPLPQMVAQQRERLRMEAEQKTSNPVLIDAQGLLRENAKLRAELEALRQHHARCQRDADETSALTNIQVMCPVCQNALWVCRCPEKT